MMKEQRHRLVVGKSITKTKGSLCSQCSTTEYTALIKTVLINERSITNKGETQGHQNDREDIIRFIPKTTTHPRAELWAIPLLSVGGKYHGLVATSTRVRTRGKSASRPWDMRDYSSRRLEPSRPSPVFHTNGYFHIHHANREDPKGNLPGYLGDFFPLVME